MSIEFKCKKCGNEIIVDNEMANKKGKCPECGNILTVPARSSNEMILVSEDEGFFPNSKLNKILHNFLDDYSNRIIQSRVLNADNDDMLMLEIRTKNGRSQIVRLIYIHEVEAIYAFSSLGIPTNINERFMSKMLFHLGKIKYPTYGLDLDKDVDNDWQFKLQRTELIKNVDKDAFYALTINLAEEADYIEEDIYGSDYL